MLNHDKIILVWGCFTARWYAKNLLLKHLAYGGGGCWQMNRQTKTESWTPIPSHANAGGIKMITKIEDSNLQQNCTENCHLGNQFVSLLSEILMCYWKTRFATTKETMHLPKRQNFQSNIPHFNVFIHIVPFNIDYVTIRTIAANKKQRYIMTSYHRIFNPMSRSIYSYIRITTYRTKPMESRATSWQNQQNDMCAQRRLRSAWASAQSNQSLHYALKG